MTDKASNMKRKDKTQHKTQTIWDRRRQRKDKMYDAIQRKEERQASIILWWETWQDGAKQHNTNGQQDKQDKTRQDKIRQDKTRQDKKRQDETRQDKNKTKTRQDQDQDKTQTNSPSSWTLSLTLNLSLSLIILLFDEVVYQGASRKIFEIFHLQWCILVFVLGS